MEQNEKLVEEIEILKQQKKELRELLQQHISSGKCWYSEECSHAQTRDPVHRSTHAFCEAVPRSVPGPPDVWSPNNASFPCCTSTSSDVSTDSEEIRNMLSLSDMDIPSHPQMHELLYLEMAADSRRQGLSTSSMSSDGEALSGFGAAEAGLCDVVQDDDDVFQAGCSEVQLEDIQPDLLCIEQLETELAHHQNVTTCDKLINDEQCFFSEP